MPCIVSQINTDNNNRSNFCCTTNFIVDSCSRDKLLAMPNYDLKPCFMFLFLPILIRHEFKWSNASKFIKLLFIKLPLHYPSLRIIGAVVTSSPSSFSMVTDRLSIRAQQPNHKGVQLITDLEYSNRSLTSTGSSIDKKSGLRVVRVFSNGTHFLSKLAFVPGISEFHSAPIYP